MARVIHTGDTHLGYTQYHVPQRRADFLAAFGQVARDAIEDDVDALVHAGDLFHDRRPTLRDIMGALDVLRTLDAADVPFLAVVGNHEAKRDAQWLDLFESLGLATRLGAEPYVVDDTAFYGLDFVPRSQRADLAYDFEDHDVTHAALVTHGLFEPFEFGEWDTASLLECSSVEFDALLLGDNHDPGTRSIDDTWVTYCGSTERVSAEEREDRGYNIVTLDDDVQVTRRGLDTRPFCFVEVDLGEGEGLDRVLERVGQYDVADAVVVVTITGDGEPVTPASVEEYAREEGALVARVTDTRDLADESEVEVSFADPDEAVRERVRDLGLSDAARSLDETIRASKVPDSKVDDEVERSVRERVAENDLTSAETVTDSASTGADDPSEAEQVTVNDGSESDIADGREPTDTAARDGQGSSDQADSPTGTPADGGSNTAASSESDAGSDDQSTMEEYL